MKSDEHIGVDKPIKIQTDDLEKYLAGVVEEVRISDSFLWLVNEQSCDCFAVILKINNRMIYVKHIDRQNSNDMTMAFYTISGYDPELFRHVVKSKVGETIIFQKLLYSDDGGVDGLKFRCDKRYFFIFASENNLIITKSIVDLAEEDDFEELPDYDDSVLFS